MKTSAPQTKEDFLKVKLNKIGQLYEGVRNCCRCGCRGEYISTSYHTSPTRSPIDDERISEQLQAAKLFIRSGANFEAGTNYFDIETAPNFTLTFYFDEIK